MTFHTSTLNGNAKSTAPPQVTAISQTLIKQMPPGATPPLILNYNASTVPIIQLPLSGDGLTAQNLADIGINQLRTPLVTVPGAAIPYPYGGKQRQVQIDLNSTASLAGRSSGAREWGNGFFSSGPARFKRLPERLRWRS
jgi:multidrug efflux pump subunit AcrB